MLNKLNVELESNQYQKYVKQQKSENSLIKPENNRKLYNIDLN